MAVYFAQLPTGSVKIGFSNDVDARLRQLESHYGAPLVLLHTEPGGRPEECAWHDRFAHLRLGRTEQFRPGPDLMAAIGRPLLVGANPEAVEPELPRAKVDATILGWAEMVAKARGITVAEYLSETLRKPVSRDFGEVMERMKRGEA